VFDIDRLTRFAFKSIIDFSQKHLDEVFYGFAIDANLLCLNSEEQFVSTLEKYRHQWGGYTDETDINTLRHNTGDWGYQGFAEFSEDTGFDMDLYLEHYHSDDEEQLNSDYSVAMKKVLENLSNLKVFDSLTKTKEFYIIKIEHNY
jgi:hypothetical protein